MTKLSLAAAALLLTGAAVAESVDEDAARGAAIGYSCLGCHGIEGYRNAYPSYRVPKLGGQKSSYLVMALKGYRDGTRPHPTMVAHASSLTDQEIEAVAAYLASLAEEVVDAGEAEAARIESAASCVACHGKNGVGLSPAWPTLAGQHEDYLAHALNQYRDGSRSDAVMAGIAAQLTDADVEALARYYASLDGLVTTTDE